MSNDEWAWLGRLPDEWVPPDELRDPTDSPALNLLIKMLSSQAFGNDDLELVGRFLSEKALYSKWMASEAKKILSPEKLVLLTVASEDRTRRIYEAWRNFISAFDSAGRRAGAAVNEKARLVATLESAISELIAGRGSFRQGRADSE